MSEPTEQPPVESPTPAERAVAGAKLLGGSVGCLAVLLVVLLVAVVVVVFFIAWADTVLMEILETPALAVASLALIVALAALAAAKRNK